MTALAEELKRFIALEGPIPVERYMALCLGHPRYGYYISRDPFGAGGDFTTSPEISQIFGELIGLWAAEVWRSMGEPAAIRLVELGPGRGTLMSDALRAACILPAFRAALSVHLVETSPILENRQRAALAGCGVPTSWHRSLDDVPPGPAIIISNEFFDALPVRQFVGTERGWCERMVGLDDEGGLAFGLAAEAEPKVPVTVRPGAVLTWPVAAIAVMEEIATRIAAEGGAALAIDYGHVEPGFGDTLQAVKAHAFTDPLAEPGEADLTVHVDFYTLAAAAKARGATLCGPVTQRQFLADLGIEARAWALMSRATPAQAEEIAAAVQRLAGTGHGEMGELFKVLGVAHPDLGALPALPHRPGLSPRDVR